jgi:hypothetical protein
LGLALGRVPVGGRGRGRRRRRSWGGFEELEFVVGAEEGAFKAHFVVGEAGESVVAGVIAHEGACEELIGSGFGFGFGGFGVGIGFVIAV